MPSAARIVTGVGTSDGADRPGETASPGSDHRSAAAPRAENRRPPPGRADDLGAAPRLARRTDGPPTASGPRRPDAGSEVVGGRRPDAAADDGPDAADAGSEV